MPNSLAGVEYYLLRKPKPGRSRKGSLLGSRFSFAGNAQTQHDLFDKANACYDARSRILHGRWQPGDEINQPRADTEGIAGTVVRHLLERQGMMEAFVSLKRDDFLDDREQSKAFTPPPFPREDGSQIHASGKSA